MKTQRTTVGVTAITFLMTITIPAYAGIQQDLDRKLSGLPTSADGVRPLKTGNPIPELDLKNADGEVVSLNTIISRKPTDLPFLSEGKGL